MTAQPSEPHSHPPLSEQPDPAAEAVNEPHLDAEELEDEIGDSEDWDEASQGSELEGPECTSLASAE